MICGKNQTRWVGAFALVLVSSMVTAAPPVVRPGRPAPTSPDPVAAAKFAVGQQVEVPFAGTHLPATVIKIDGGKVVVKLKSGMERPYNPAEVHTVADGGAAVAPVKPEMVKPAAGGGEVPPAPPEPATPIVPGDVSAIKDPAWDGAGWSAKADPAVQQVASFSDRATPLPKATEKRSLERIREILYTDLKTAQALVVYHSPTFFDAPEQTRYHRINLNTGALMETVSLEPGRNLVAISPDGKTGAARVRINEGKHTSGFDDATNSSILMLQLGGGKATAGLHWRPYDPSLTLKHVQFVDNQHLLTQSAEGQVIFWELPAAGGQGAPKAIYRITAGKLLSPTLSPGRKTYLVEDNGAIRVIDTATGASLGAVADVNLTLPASASFRTDGMLLAVSSGNFVWIVHMSSGKPARTFPVPNTYGRSNQVDWIDQNRVLLGGSYSADIAKRLVTWAYHLGQEVHAYGGRMWFVTSGMDQKLMSLVIGPTPQIPGAPAKAIQPEDLLVFKPGVKVTIEMNADAPDEMRQKIQKSLEDQIKAMGMEVAPDQPVRVQALSKAGESRAMQYRRIGMGGGGIQTVNVTDKIYQLLVTLNGQEVWTAQTIAAASTFISPKKDQSTEQAIAEQQNAVSSWLATTKLPKVLLDAKGYPPVGTSMLTARGLQVIPPKKD